LVALPHLDSLTVRSCSGLQHIVPLAQLAGLKVLNLHDLSLNHGFTLLSGLLDRLEVLVLDRAYFTDLPVTVSEGNRQNALPRLQVYFVRPMNDN
jgi:hypothetical protein